jgi:hypothetical protein
MANAAPTPQQIAAQNALARQMLIETGLHMTKRLQPVSGALGSTIRIPLQNMGVMTGITLNFTVPITPTAAATASPFAPYNIAQMVKYTDYAGVDRIVTSGLQLHLLNAFKTNRPLYNASKLAGFIPGEGGIDTNILKLPTAVASDTIQFSLYLPMAYDPASDLRGAVLSQTIYGDHTVSIQLPTSLVGADSLIYPYTAGTVPLTSGAQVTVEAYQNYIMPQNGVSNLPMVDLATIYAIEGNYTDNTNISAGQAKYINWPNARAVLSAMHIFDNGGAGTLNGADLQQITMMGNSNTNIKEMSPKFLRAQMRNVLGVDVPSGVYFINTRTQPVSTQIYGNVQTKFDILTANTNAYFLNQYESFYMAGTPLPGVIQ